MQSTAFWPSPVDRPLLVHNSDERTGFCVTPIRYVAGMPLQMMPLDLTYEAFERERDRNVGHDPLQAQVWERTVPDLPVTSRFVVPDSSTRRSHIRKHVHGTHT